MSTNKQKRKNKNRTLEGASLIVFTDGGCEKQGKRGAYGIVILNRNTKRIDSFSGAYRKTTNSRMEVIAAIKALKLIDTKDPIVLYSDSEYLVNTMKGLYARKKNMDLWRDMDIVMKDKNVLFVWVKGHAGYKYNEVCDKLCTEAMLNGPYETDEGYERAISKAAEMSKKYTDIGSDREAMNIPINTPAMSNVKPDISSVWKYCEEYNVHKDCASMLCNFYKYDFHAFKHYAEIKTFGKDYWSGIRLRELQKILGSEESAIIEKYSLTEDEKANTMRWRLRGMTLNDAIRKMLVDRKVASEINARSDDAQN